VECGQKTICGSRGASAPPLPPETVAHHVTLSSSGDQRVHERTQKRSTACRSPRATLCSVLKTSALCPRSTSGPSASAQSRRVQADEPGGVWAAPSAPRRNAPCAGVCSKRLVGEIRPSRTTHTQRPFGLVRARAVPRGASRAGKPEPDMCRRRGRTVADQDGVAQGPDLKAGRSLSGGELKARACARRVEIGVGVTAKSR